MSAVKSTPPPAGWPRKVVVLVVLAAFVAGAVRAVLERRSAAGR